MTAVPTIPAATVVLLRDSPRGLETLMLRRNADLAFAGGMWVWPGGRIDPDDYPTGQPDEDPAVLQASARRAAVREAREEADLEVDPESLVWFSHWTPPPITPKRFATWFFAAPAPAGTVHIDGGEIHGHAWMTPSEAMARRNALEIALSPPTWITLEHLAEFDRADEALQVLAQRPPEWFATRFATVEGGAVALYDGDAGYEDENPDRPGGRHRLWMVGDTWRYERSSGPVEAS
ncbi:MAG TPA: NUDIX domain-containing protein [Acidimicrobiales bacterium]